MAEEDAYKNTVESVTGVISKTISTKVSHNKLSLVALNDIQICDYLNMVVYVIGMASIQFHSIFYIFIPIKLNVCRECCQYTTH